MKSLKNRLVEDDKGREGSWSSQALTKEAHLEDSVTTGLLTMARDIDEHRLALKAKAGVTTAHGWSIEGFTAKSRFSANPFAVCFSGITQLRCCKWLAGKPAESGSEAAAKLEERYKNDAVELQVAHDNVAEIMELHREVRGQVVAFHGFCGHLSLEIATKVAIAHAQKEAELRDFLRMLALEDPSVSALAGEDIALLAPAELALVERAWERFKGEKQREKDEQVRKRAEEEEGARKRREEAARARAEERRRREEMRLKREAERKAQEEAEARRLAEEERKTKGMAAAEKARELERIAEERRRQAEIEARHKKVLVDGSRC